MVAFTALIKKFGEQGEKTGWTYIEIPAEIAAQLKPETRKSFRVKGHLDQFNVSGVALTPMGGGAFIMALNATLRKGIKKRAGAMVNVQLEEDKRERELPEGFMESLADAPAALEKYNSLQKTYKSYFAIWISSVKTDAARAKRIAQAVTALAQGFDFVQMIHSLKKQKDDY